MEPRRPMPRRRFLGSTLAATAGLAGATGWPEPACPDPFAGGRLVATLPLSGLGGVDHPLEKLLDSGLDARLATDLSKLTEETLVIPNDRFFVRSAAPAGLEARMPWTIRLSGLVRKPQELALDSLVSLVVPMGTHLVECAGNNNPANFGLMSAATWAGIPLERVLERAGPLPGATRVLVSGMDPEPGRARSSRPGASWIFTLAEVERWRPFLATQMNGAPLPPLHGWPVRLLVPRWYGCASIKWVDEIRLVDDDAPATPQMKEFARRTLQDGVPDRARDYRPAAVDQAAMPVRVEKWLVSGAITYRVVGVMWGGERVTDALEIGFGRDDAYAPVAVCPKPVGNDTWTLWSHVWRPPAPGRYTIALRVSDPKIPARRLGLYYYVREVRVDEV
jgi:DMSO/TMAO reductase YedYZ molybdopterin-dependent catalytic subunit